MFSLPVLSYLNKDNMPLGAQASPPSQQQSLAVFSSDDQQPSHCGGFPPPSKASGFEDISPTGSQVGDTYGN